MRSSERRYMQEEHSQGRRSWQAPEEREEHERGLIERVTDEIRSWFGQDEGRRRYDFDRPEYEDPRRGEYMSQGEEFMGPGFRSRPGGYQGGYPGHQEYGSSSSGMGEYGGPSHRYGGQGGMMGQRMGGQPGRHGYGYGGGFGPGGGRGQGRHYQQPEDFPQGREMQGGHGGQGFGRGYGHLGRGLYEGETFGGYGFGGQGFGGQSFGGSGLAGQGFGAQTVEQPGRFAGRGPKGYRRSDDRIMEEVCEVLSRNPYIDPGDIEVKVQQGKVTLSGTVDDRETKRLVEDLSEDISGVREVQNQLRVSRGASNITIEERATRAGGEQQQQQPQTSGRGREA